MLLPCWSSAFFSISQECFKAGAAAQEFQISVGSNAI